MPQHRVRYIRVGQRLFDEHALRGGEQYAALLRLGAYKNLLPNVFSDREFAMQANAVEDILQGEREAAQERWLKAGEQMALAQAFASNPEAWDAWEEFDRALDADDETWREATRRMINMIRSPVPANAPAGGSLGGVDAAVQQARSQSAGGIPGNAEGQPVANQELIDVLPQNIRRTAGELTPGGTAA